MSLGTAAMLIVSFATGIAVSAATVVIISVLGIVPHMAAVTGTKRFINSYAFTLCAGVVIGALLSMLQPRLGVPALGGALFFVFELLSGVYTGFFLSALAEVLDIFPAIYGTLKLKRVGAMLIIALAAGKCAGTLLFQLTPYFK